MSKQFSMELAGRTLTVEIGKVAAQANGAAFMHYGDTVVLSTATASDKPREGIDFFPRCPPNASPIGLENCSGSIGIRPDGIKLYLFASFKHFHFCLFRAGGDGQNSQGHRTECISFHGFRFNPNHHNQYLHFPREEGCHRGHFQEPTAQCGLPVEDTLYILPDS